MILRRRTIVSLVVAVMSSAGFGCGKSEKQEHKSGRFNYVRTLRYGSVGTHGSQGWYVSDQTIYVKARRWSPPGIKMDDIARCEPSPNESIEALKCYSFADSKESVFVLRMKDDQPDWVVVTLQEYHGGNNLGKWVGDGRWLLFRDYCFDVLTSERKTIKGLPDDPGKYFRAASPDMKTIIYEEYCFIGRPDLPDDADKETKISAQCKQAGERATKGLLGFWLIDTETGAVTSLKLHRDKYPTIDRSKTGEANFNERFQQLLTWQKDGQGRDQLVAPTSD